MEKTNIRIDEAFSAILDTTPDPFTIKDKFFKLKEHFFEILKRFDNIGRQFEIDEFRQLSKGFYEEIIEVTWPKHLTSEVLMTAYLNPNHPSVAGFDQPFRALADGEFMSYVSCIAFSVKPILNQFLDVIEEPDKIDTYQRREYTGDARRSFANRIMSHPVYRIIFSGVPREKSFAGINDFDLPGFTATLDQMRRELLITCVQDTILMCYNCVNVLFIPDFDAQGIKQAVDNVMANDQVMKNPKYKNLTKIIKNTSDLFDRRFPVYYRDYAISGNINVFFESYFKDAVRETGGMYGEVNENLFVDLQEHLIAIAKKRQSANPQITKFLSTIDKHTKKKRALLDAQQRVADLYRESTAPAES